MEGFSSGGGAVRDGSSGSTEPEGIRVERERQYGDTLRVLFRRGGIEIGTFRCAPGHPLFRDSGPIRDFSVVFPRTSGSVQHEGKAPFFASPLVAPLYNRGQRYVRCGDNPHDPRGDRSDWIGIHDQELVLQIAREFDPWVDDAPETPFRFPFAPAPPAVYARQRLLLHRLRGPEAIDADEIENEAIEIVRDLLAAAYRPEGPRVLSAGEHRAFAAARLELMRAFREPLSLAELARRVEVSVPHLARLFRVGFGMSVHQSIVQLRLRAALEPLRDPGCDLSALALDLGFASHSHFTAAFRRAFGRTPSEVRRRKRRKFRGRFPAPTAR